MNNFPKNLRYLRKKSCLKQEDMLNYLRVTRSTWSNYEIGHTNPRLNEVINFSRFFGVTLDQLITQDLEAENPLPKKKGQRKAREYQPPEGISMVAEPDIIYVLQELNRLRDEVKTIKEKEKEK